MKLKNLMLAVMLVTACTMLLPGCSSSDDVKVIEKTGSNDAAGVSEEASGGYVFSYKGTDISVDADATGILEALGEANSYFESPSCAAQGIDKLYTYNDFELETYPDGDIDRGLYVRLKSDAVSTQEGITTSSTKDEIKEAYGEPTSEVSGNMVYEKGDMKLKFIFDGDSVVSIEYDSPLA